RARLGRPPRCLRLCARRAPHRDGVEAWALARHRLYAARARRRHGEPAPMSAAAAIALSALAMTLIVGGRYLLSSGAFALATRLRHPGLYRGREAQIRREIGWSLASAAIYGIPAGVVAWGWQARDWTR